MDTYFPVFVLLVLAAGFAATMLLIATYLGPKKFTEVKDDPFECGTVGSGDPTARFSVKFYLVAMIFILFDIEIVFLYPWAVNAIDLGWVGYFAVVWFLAVLTLGLAFVWRRGVLDWQS